MSAEIEYRSTTTDPCHADGCPGILQANRAHVYYRCPICSATYTRLGFELRADRIESACVPPAETKVDDLEYSRNSNEMCAIEWCGGQLHSSEDLLRYRCPKCHEVYMRFGLQLVRDASIPRAVVLERKKP